MIKIEEDREFLIAQRQPGRKGCLGGNRQKFGKQGKKIGKTKT